MNEFLDKHKVAIALLTAILFHVSGLIGILYGNKDWFLSLTWLNLCLMGLLLIWTHPNKSFDFWRFLFLCFVIGFGSELIGVKTGLLFGEYKYGKILGPNFFGVPLLIGIQWFVTTYSSGNLIFHFYSGILKRFSQNEIGSDEPSKRILTYGLIIDAAILATFFDWILEPVAVKLGYWQWLPEDEIPVYNYVCWFLISCILQLFFFLDKDKISKPNNFAIHLLFIQFLFFLSLRLFLK